MLCFRTGVGVSELSAVIVPPALESRGPGFESRSASYNMLIFPLASWVLITK